MHRRRRYPEVVLHVSFRRRETVNLRVVVDEGEVLTLLRRVARLGMFGFRETFQEQLQLATAVYPAATIEIRPTGLVLAPSDPPVAPRKTVVSLTR